MKQIIEWKDEYLIGISVVDDQHKHIFNVTNILYNYILEGKSNDKLGNTLLGMIKENISQGIFLNILIYLRIYMSPYLIRNCGLQHRKVSMIHLIVSMMIKQTGMTIM